MNTTFGLKYNCTFFPARSLCWSESCESSLCWTAMKRFSQILCVAFLVAQVRGQNCVEEALNCDDPVPTIFKLGDQSCACNSAGHAGALKFLNGKVQVCLGNEWKTFQFVEDIEYGTEKNPGSSCKDIKDKAVGKQLSNGVFWIKLQGIVKISDLLSFQPRLQVPTVSFKG